MFFRSQRKSAGELSLSDSIEGDDDSGLSLMDVLAEEDDMFENLSMTELRAQVRCCVATALEPREAEIIRMRYGLDNAAQPLTQREVAAKTGISRSYVSRIEKKALEKLRRAMEASSETVL